MTTQESTIFGMVLFFGFLALISGSVFYESGRLQSQSFVNQSNENLSIITTGEGFTQLTLCDYDAGNIPILSGLIWGADCVADYVGFLFSFVFINTPIEWLAIIFLSIGSVVIYIAVKLLRGGG